jgi:spore coat polysaccharide biosynthesis protein SpsF
MTRVVASIEARMASSRLPGKVLAPIAGTPTLTRLIERLRRATTLDAMVLATTTSAADDALETWAADHGVACFRGSEDDVLGRVVGAHQAMGSDVIVELTGDCPLVDPALVDRAVRAFLDQPWDVVTTTRGSGYPQGTEVQVFRRTALEDVAARVHDPAVREHVSLHFYEHPERYRIFDVTTTDDASVFRLQLDYPDDLRFLDALCARLDHQSDAGIETIVGLLRADPALAAINAHCQERPAR